MSDFDNDIGIDGNLGIGTWGLDASDIAPTLQPTSIKLVQVSWPVGVLSATVIGAVALVAYKAGEESMRKWVDEWTGGPD